VKSSIETNGRVQLPADDAPQSPPLAAPPDIFAKTRQFARLAEAKEKGLYPYFIPVESSRGNEVMIQGAPRVMVGSNNYLGLTHDPRVIAAAQDAISKYGTACTGSRFLNGNTDLHDRIEERLAALTGKEAALVFSTGFQTNLGVIATLVGRSDTVFIDKLDHASIVDGCHLSGGETVRFRHGDFAELETKMRRTTRGGKLVVVDGVFSMEGDIVDLPNLVELCAKYDARLAVDDAHSVGVLGATGAGTAEHFDLTERVDLIIGTFSKSFASIGGFVAGEQQVIVIRKPVRERDRNHLRFVASQPCLICGRTPSDAHHIKYAEARAMGRKVSDKFTVPVCRLHHRELHRRGDERAWWEAQGTDPLAIAANLWDKNRGIASPAETTSDDNRLGISGQRFHSGSRRLQPQNNETKPILSPEVE